MDFKLKKNKIFYSVLYKEFSWVSRSGRYYITTLPENAVNKTSYHRYEGIKIDFV